MNKPIVAFLLLFCLKAEALMNAQPLEKSADVVRIIFTNGSICSGVYIDSFTILTAAHCLFSDGPNTTLQISKVLSDNDEALDVSQRKFFAQPEYDHQSWPDHDIGLIKTTQNKKFKNEFTLDPLFHSFKTDVLLMGTGINDLVTKTRARRTGENSAIRIVSTLVFLGQSSNVEFQAGIHTSIAPNDSGGPIVEKQTNHIIGVMSTTTVEKSAQYSLPALCTGSLTSAPSNYKFIYEHLGPL